jgi:hypothetical protein
MVLEGHMELWNESYVTVTVGGDIPTADHFRTLVDAIETSSLDLVPMVIDTERAVLGALSEGRPVRLEAEDGILWRIQDFERQVHRLGLDCVVTEKVAGETTIRSWRAGADRPAVANLDGGGRVLADAEMLSGFARAGLHMVEAYLDEVRSISHDRVRPLAADISLVQEVEASLEAARAPFMG